MNRIYLRKLLPGKVFDAFKNIDSTIQKMRWIKKGCPLPAIHPVKQSIIKSYQQHTGYNVLIETGTYTGEMVYTQRNNFKKIHSIELSDYYYKKAVERFKKFLHIKLWHGNSSDILPLILNELHHSAIFWLDGHYSGGKTAGNEHDQKQTPILSELDAVFTHKGAHLILIDDARNFIGTNDYPTIEELKQYLNNKNRNYTFEMEVDVIRIKLF